MKNWKTLSVVIGLFAAVACSSDPAADGGGESADAISSTATAADVCAGKSNGFYCNGDRLAKCASGATAKTTVCASGCLPGSVGDDRCAGDPCTGIPDGNYCAPEERAIYACSQTRTNDRIACALGCAAGPTSGRDVCRSCATGQTECNGVCIATGSDPQNCGQCGNVCPNGPQGSAVCQLGRCGLNCTTGYGDCDGNVANGCEAHLDGPASCLACGNVCAAAPHGSPTCTTSGCGLACQTGYDNCNGSLADGCETFIAGDDQQNCRGCGWTCGSNQACRGGFCKYKCTSDQECRRIDARIPNCHADGLCWSSP